MNAAAQRNIGHLRLFQLETGIRDWQKNQRGANSEEWGG